MRLPPEILAASLWENIRAWSAAKSGTFQALVFFGVFALIALAVFSWALIFRQQPRRRHHRSHSKPDSTTGSGESPGGFFSRQRHKHRRKKHRPVNPTLSETGGLPAPRAGKTPPNAQL